jgi:hypothetical protein
MSSGPGDQATLRALGLYVKKVRFIGVQRKALALAVRNNKTEQRFSGLLARLNLVRPSSRQ